MPEIFMVTAVAYKAPFVAGRDKPISYHTINVFNQTDQQWLRHILSEPDNFITLTPEKG